MWTDHPLRQLQLIYPTLTDEDFEAFIELTDSGNGIEISRWDHPSLPLPSPTQIAATTATAQAAQAAVDLAAANYAAAMISGYPVAPEGFVLGIADEDRKAWTELLAMLNEGLSLGVITPETTTQIKALDGVLHTVTIARLKQMIFGLGMHYKALWDQLQS